MFFYSRRKEIFFIVNKLYKNQENIRSTTLYFIDPENKNIFVLKKFRKTPLLSNNISMTNILTKKMKAPCPPDLIPFFSLLLH